MTTQGRSDLRQYVTRYIIKYSADAFYWTPYRKYSRVQVDNFDIALSWTNSFLNAEINLQSRRFDILVLTDLIKENCVDMSVSGSIFLGVQNISDIMEDKSP